MKKFALSMMFLWIGIIAANAQNKIITVSGKVIDTSDKSAVIQAGVQLLHLPDSTFAAGSVTSSNGTFSLPKVKEGSYLLKVTYVGYGTSLTRLKLSASRPSYYAGIIGITPSAIQLNEAVIVGHAPPVNVKGDTLEYSASAYRVAQGAMLEDLVKKIPGVEVSSDGKITHNGKEIKKILVDGKEFFSDDPAVAMKNLPANMVDKVKAYDKKSDMAKYTGIDDGDDESVLDLSVKKGMKAGLIGNFLAGYGSKDRYEAQAMLSKFKDDTSKTLIASANNTNSKGFSEFGDSGAGMNSGNGSGVTASKQIGANIGSETTKVRVEGNVEYGHTNNIANRKVSSETFLGNSSTYGLSDNASKRIRDDVRLDMHLILRPDTLTNIVIMPTISHSKTNSNSTSNSQTSSTSDFSSLINNKDNYSNGKNKNTSLSGRFMFFRRLSNKGRNFMLGANLGYNKTDADADSYSKTIFNSMNDSTSILNRYTDRNSDSKSWGFQASYTEPIFKNHFLQFRYEFSHSRQLSDSKVYDNLGDYLNHSNIEYSDSLSSKLTNYYNSNTFSLSLRGVYTKMMYGIGISLTPQSSKSVTAVPTSRAKTLKQNVINFAPNVMFRFMFNKQHFLMFRYDGRSSAPDVSDLQEVISITDPLNLQYGNPNLKPSFTNRFRLFYNHFFTGSQMSISANAFYNNTLNSVANKMTYNTQTGGRIYTKTNVNGNWNASGYFSFNTPLKDKRFTISSNSGGNFSNAVSYTTVGNQTDAVLSNTHNLTANERLSTAFRTDLFDVTLNGGISYNLTKNNKQTNSNRETFDYTYGMNTDWNLPWNISISTDFNAHLKTGYSGGLNKNEYIWNAQIAKTLFNNKATLRFKIYDILRQESNLTRSISETMMSDTQYNTVGSYFMVHFVYRINTLGGKSMRQERRGGFGGPRGGFHGGFGGGFGGGRPPM
jgi:hypothetical protein